MTVVSIAPGGNFATWLSSPNTAVIPRGSHVGIKEIGLHARAAARRLLPDAQLTLWRGACFVLASYVTEDSLCLITSPHHKWTT